MKIHPDTLGKKEDKNLKNKNKKNPSKIPFFHLFRAQPKSTFFLLSGPIKKSPDEICARPCPYSEKPRGCSRQKMSTNKYPNAPLKCHYPETVKANVQVKWKMPHCSFERSSIYNVLFFSFFPLGSFFAAYVYIFYSLYIRSFVTRL